MAKTKTLRTMAKALSSGDKRENIRFEPDPGTIAWIDVRDDGSKRAFQAHYLALVNEESHTGCGLIMKQTKDLQTGSLCRIKVGHQKPLLGQVRWRVDLDSQAMRIGIMYLD